MPQDNTKYIPLDNASANGHHILDKLSEPRCNPDSARIAEEAKIGSLDDNVDITDPNYDETKAEAIEAELQPTADTP